LEHLVPALCFAAFLVGDPARVLSIPSYLKSRNRAAQ
jgi:hypothetical protein